MEDKNFKTGVPCEEVAQVVEQPKQDEDQNRAGAAAVASEDVGNECLSKPVSPVDQNGPCAFVCSSTSNLSSFQRSSLPSQSCVYIKWQFKKAYPMSYELDFRCEVNKMFWYRIRGEKLEIKNWGDFLKQLRESFPQDKLTKEQINNITLKVLKRLLQLKDSADDSDEIKVEVFIRLVGWFGPMAAEEGKCIALREVKILHEGSTVSTKEGKRKSWFAGYLDRSKAEEYLLNEEVGTFLVRFSVTEQKSGSFVLSIVVKQRCIEHFIIERRAGDHAFPRPWFADFRLGDIDVSFRNLVELIDYFEKNDISSDYPGLTCDYICPDLPLNRLVTPYKRAYHRKT